MRALILAAGIGSRLGGYTAALPKPMIPLGGRPILESNVRLLVAHGFREIVINTHYRPETIVAHFGDGAAFGAQLQYAYEADLLGTAGALEPLRDFFTGETFAVVYGDNRSTCDLGAMLGAHRRSNAAITVALWHRADVSQSGVVRFGDDGRITGFIEKPDASPSGGAWVNAGIYLCEPAMLEMIARIGATDFGREVFPAALATGVPLQAYPMKPPERLWWIDTPADYERARRELAVEEPE